MENFRPRDALQQRDNQTCLACCFLMYYSTLFPDRSLDYNASEKELHAGSFGLYPEYYALTHAASFTRKFPEASITMLVDNSYFAEYLSATNKEERVAIQVQPISLDWIKAELAHRPLILYTDAFYLQGGTVHLPHFVYAFNNQGEIKIADPAFGSVRPIADKELEDGIIGLKYQMLWSPIALSVQDK